MSNPNIATNKKAFHNFHLGQTWECGLVLTGGEVKSIRAGGVNFTDSFARIKGEELFLHNLHIVPYAQASYLNEEPLRQRKLLLHKKELLKIIGLAQQKKLAIVPTRLYFNKRGFVKVEIALATGKKQYDKREDIKKRDIERDLKRAVNTRRR
ncbi:MAG: SsrA-binding protein SmpB [Candidatus Omnitrophota bacterium]|nr:SsrA-binding protein SmpB [Candidatus Omnitrophota bacterium]